MSPRIIALAVAAAALSGCSADEGELRAWMDQVRRDTAPIRDAIPEPKRFAPFRYDNVGQVDPFSLAKFSSPLDRAAVVNKNGLKPDMDRRREALESYPLE